MAGCATATRHHDPDVPTPTASPTDFSVGDVAASWDPISGLFLGSGSAEPYGPNSMYVLRGTVSNGSRRPVHHVVLRYELLDEHGNVLHFQEGYNRRAENFGDGSGRDGDIRPLEPGDRDDFRMVFFGDEVPHFTTHRISVVEVTPVPAAAG